MTLFESRKMRYFNPIDHDFYLEPKLNISFDRVNNRFLISDYGCKTVDEIKPGIYVWTVTDDKENIIPLYFGLFGQRAKNPTLRNRFKQHYSGLRSSLKGKPPTAHWRDCLFPETMCFLEKYKKIDIYFGHFEKKEIDNLETSLIQKFDTPWNKAKK